MYTPPLVSVRLTDGALDEVQETGAPLHPNPPTGTTQVGEPLVHDAVGAGPPQVTTDPTEVLYDPFGDRACTQISYV